jgi:hypothetical protein
MSTFRYQTNGRWYKGNTHLHTTASDGWKTPTELAAMYHNAGYHFLFRTDHWVASDVMSDKNKISSSDDPSSEEGSDSLLWLDGIELDGADSTGGVYHVVALGSFQNLPVEMGLEKAMQSARAQGGLLILAHPQWTGNTFEDARRWQFDGVEVYNNVCRWLNGKGDGSAYWNAMLDAFPNTLALASDDVHLGPKEDGCWNGGWVVANAAECTREAILAAIHTGNFYASCGPEIYSIEYDGEQVTLQCSPVQFARIVGPRWSGDRVGSFNGNQVTQAAFKVPQDWEYVYLELEDAQGRRAWTNPLFVR